MNLTYEAIDTSGRSIRDLIEADTIKAAGEQLRQRGLMVTNIQTASQSEVEHQARQANVAATGIKLPLKQLVLFTRQMAMLLTSGSAVVPALEAIARQPETGGRVFVSMLLAAALIEGFTFFAIVTCNGLGKFLATAATGG